jgi:integrase/recombinase XerD
MTMSFYDERVCQIIMNVQRIIKQDGKISWIVVDKSFLPVVPILDFLCYCENREYSPNTIRGYARSLSFFWGFLVESEYDWKKISSNILAEFIKWLRYPTPSKNVIYLDQTEVHAKRTERTINNYLAAVYSFYNFHLDEGTVDNINLYNTIQMHQRQFKPFLHHASKSNETIVRKVKLKEPKTLPKTLTTAQYESLLSACNKIRDKFMIALLFETGMRIGQVLGLRHEDISSWDNRITVTPRKDNLNAARAKSKNAYVVDVPPSLMSIYTEYLIHEFGDIDSDYVFVNIWDGEIGSPILKISHSESGKKGNRKATLRPV